MNIVIGARDTTGRTHRFHVEVSSLDEIPEVLVAVGSEMKTTGRRVAARVILASIPGGKP